MVSVALPRLSQRVQMLLHARGVRVQSAHAAEDMLYACAYAHESTRCDLDQLLQDEVIRAALIQDAWATTDASTIVEAQAVFAVVNKRTIATTYKLALSERLRGTFDFVDALLVSTETIVHAVEDGFEVFDELLNALRTIRP